MSENIYNIFSDVIELPSVITDNWYRDSDGVQWSEEDDLLALYEGEGDTYSCEIYGKSVERDGYILFKLYDGCGSKYQAIFQKDKEVVFTPELIDSLYQDEDND
ncbi:hypothetical protein D3C85_1214810 [compost metagenome]